MASPLAMDANGASCTTGGILRGRAQGNVFNHADVADQVHVGPCMGKVLFINPPEFLNQNHLKLLLSVR